MMKTLFYLLAIVVLSAGLFGCGKPAEEKQKAADEKIVGKHEPFKRSEGKAY